MKTISYLLMLMLLSLACCITSCSNHKQQETLNRAESLMESHPDSALLLLKGIDKSELGSKGEQARYALLLSMALDKNYIDTTSFDILQPAIDYYLESGNPTEQLRTYYYQGRIFQNKKDRDNALNSFIKGIDVSPDSDDSLSIARTLVAQGGLYNEFYDFESYTDCYLNAAEIYKKLSLKAQEFDCLLNALNGAIILGEKAVSDSLLTICNGFHEFGETQQTLRGYELSYVLEFGSKQEIKDFINSKWDYTDFDINGLLNLASANNKVHSYEKAKKLLSYVSKFDHDTLKYQTIYVSTLEGLGEYKEALSIYKNFSHRMDSINAFKFDQKAQSINERHRIELKTQEDARFKDKVIWGCIGGILILVMGIIILILLVRSNKSQRNLALQKAKTAELENEKLKSDKENLENERDSLKNLLDAQDGLPPEVQKEIQVRIEMLNSLLAGYITSNEQYEKPYETWVKELTENTEEFMNSNRLAFQVSHPRFIQYFENHDLTVSEINYVCLYAIGLRGKEVGNYMKKRSHVNISSGIRKKLGIDKHETNIGIYVRKLLKEL